MKSTAFKRVLAVLLIILTIFGWFITVKGIPGKMDPVASKIQRGLDIDGGVYVVLEATDTEGMSDEELRDAMERAQLVILRRVDAMGLTNPNVSLEGTDRIRVELPGVENAEDAIEMIGKTAQLQFTLADGTVILTGNNVKDAALSTSSEYAGYVVSLEFDSEGAEAFTEATQVTANGGVPATITAPTGALVPDNSIVIMLDDQIISYPTARKVITGSSCIIEGNFTQDEAANLAALIRGGSLPVPLQEISSSSQTATIGVDAFHKSVIAGIIGLIIIFLMMLFFYRIMGVAADIALALYVVIVIGAMALMGSVLTLPGIAGIILSIGMAVDANVIIFNRIKEEIAAGKTIRVAVKSGYKRALGTVIDSQVTTLIATVILYQLGTSSVKGFAWTLMLGIIASIITAVFVTQLFLVLFADSKAFAKNSLFCMNEDGTQKFHIKKKFTFIANRKKFFIGSAAVIVVGLVLALTVGMNYGIDFTGGTMIHMDMHGQVSEQDVKAVADEQGINTNQMEVLFTGDNGEQAIIKTNESLDNDARKAFTGALEEKFGLTDEDVLESEFFGPTVGKELTKNALTSLLLAAIGMLIYIRIRFREWKFGAAAILGVLHDVFIMIAFYAVFRVTVNNPFIAAILTVVGYSINDTIVIFDRVRENARLRHSGSTEQLLDDSINQTLSRSVMTSLTTLVVMIPLLVMAGDAIREFTLPLMVGVITGCYSSIFICSPLYYVMTKKERQSRYEKQIASKGKKSGKKYVGAVSTKKPKETTEEPAETGKNGEKIVGAIPADMKDDFEEITGEKQEILASVPQDVADEFDKITEEELLEEAEVSDAIDEDILEAAEEAVMGKKKGYHLSSAKAHKKTRKAKR